MKRRHDTSKVIWDLVAFLGKRGWTVDQVEPPPAVCMAARWVMASAFVMVFVDGTARGSGRPEELVTGWVERLPETLKRQANAEFSGALSVFLALTFCDLTEPLATEALGCKDLRVFAAVHGFCRVVDFEECTIREHSGVPFFTSYGAQDIRDFLAQWKAFIAGGTGA